MEQDLKRLQKQNPQDEITSEYVFDLFENHVCTYCKEGFTWDNRPTLDRIDNDLGHTKDNCVVACEYCNKYRARDDPELTKLRIQLRQFARKMGLPMTLSRSDADLYHDIRSNITGGLSNVMNRMNVKGQNTIHKLTYQDPCNCDSYEIYSEDTELPITHCVGVDFNSLYPSSMSSIYNQNIPYTNH
jgi:hypothetical protein